MTTTDFASIVRRSDRYGNRDLALARINNSVKALRVVMVEVGSYLVTTVADASRLVRMGFEVVR